MTVAWPIGVAFMMEKLEKKFLGHSQHRRDKESVSNSVKSIN